MAQSALSVFAISPIAVNTIGVRAESNLLLGRYSESASRTRSGIVGAISGCTIRAAYSDPILNIEVSGWVISRGGFANCAPGTLIDGSIIANWRNGATGANQEDHFGWDVMEPGNSFIVQDPTFTRVPGRLSEVSMKLTLECTGGKATGGGTTGPVDNGGDTVPEVGTVWRIVTIYTDRGTFQLLSQSEDPQPFYFFGYDVGQWDEGAHHRPVSSIGREYVNDPAPDGPPINVLGINIQAPSGVGSAAGGAWIAGSAAEVTGASVALKPAGNEIWILTYSTPETTSGDLISDQNSELVTGPYTTAAAAAAAISPPATVADFLFIYHHGAGFVKNTDPPFQGDPMSWFSAKRV